MRKVPREVAGFMQIAMQSTLVYPKPHLSRTSLSKQIFLGSKCDLCYFCWKKVKCKRTRKIGDGACMATRPVDTEWPNCAIPAWQSHTSTVATPLWKANWTPSTLGGYNSASTLIRVQFMDLCLLENSFLWIPHGSLSIDCTCSVPLQCSWSVSGTWNIGSLHCSLQCIVYCMGSVHCSYTV